MEESDSETDERCTELLSVNAPDLEDTGAKGGFKIKHFGKGNSHEVRKSVHHAGLAENSSFG